jgi:hypothetical protein
MKYRWAEVQNDRTSFFAAHLVRRQVGVTFAALAAASAEDNKHLGQATGESLRLLQLASAGLRSTLDCRTRRVSRSTRIASAVSLALVFGAVRLARKALLVERHIASMSATQYY